MANPIAGKMPAAIPNPLMTQAGIELINDSIPLVPKAIAKNVTIEYGSGCTKLIK